MENRISALLRVTSTHLHQHHAVPGNLGVEMVSELAQVPLPPEIPSGLLLIGICFFAPGILSAARVMRVAHIDPDTGEVTVKDGPKFGVQDLPPGAQIYIKAGSLVLAKFGKKFAAGDFDLASEGAGLQKSRVPEQEGAAQRKTDRHLLFRAGRTERCAGEPCVQLEFQSTAARFPALHLADIKRSLG